MNDRELGEAIGSLTGELRGIGRRLDDLQESNSREHAANARQHAANAVRVEGLREEIRLGLEQKADKAEIKEVREDVKTLSNSSAKNEGRDSMLGTVAKGAIGAAITIGISALFGHPVIG